jgi:ParB family chromosome partitioning protein
VQELLLSDPRKAREVAVLDRLVNAIPHEGLRKLSQEREPGRAYAAMEAHVRLCAGWLGIEIDDERRVWTQFPARGADARSLYEAVQALGDHQLEQLHTLLAALAFGQVVCERLDTSDSLFNRVARDLGTDMRKSWRPDRAFLERRNRDQLAVIAYECGYALSAGAVRSYKKSELIEWLLRHFANAHATSDPTPAQIKAREWLPEAMLFPAIDPDAQNAPGHEEPDEDEPDENEPEAGVALDQAA